MRTRLFLIATLLLLLFARETASADPALKIGTYDSRSIAVAWAASSHNDVGAKMQELKSAQEAKDEKKVQELEEWGAQHQQVLHLQGFGRVPVAELLEPVRAQLQTLAAELGLAAIVMSCDYVGANVEIVDVTEQMVEFFQPSEKTKATALGIREHEPMPLIELLSMKH